MHYMIKLADGYYIKEWWGEEDKRVEREKEKEEKEKIEASLASAGAVAETTTGAMLKKLQFAN